MGPLIVFGIAFGLSIFYYPNYKKIGFSINHSSRYIATANRLSVDRVLISASKAPENNDGTDAESNIKRPGNNNKTKPPVPSCTGGDDNKDCNNK